MRIQHLKSVFQSLVKLCTCTRLFIVPRFRESAGTLNLIRPFLCLSVSPSVCHKNFNLGHNFCTFTGRAFILACQYVHVQDCLLSPAFAKARGH